MEKDIFHQRPTARMGWKDKGQPFKYRRLCVDDSLHKNKYQTKAAKGGNRYY
jgi:hypothetical protein